MSSLDSIAEQSPPRTEALQGARGRFPTLNRLAYINSGSYGLLGDTVRAAIDDYMDHRVDVGADWDLWVDRAERVRDKVARLLNARREEMAVTARSEENKSELQSLMRTSYAVFCLKKKTKK